MMFLFLLLFLQVPSPFAAEFRRVDPTLTIFRTIHESAVGNGLTLSVVLADPPRNYDVTPDSRFWADDSLIGIFTRDESGRVSTVTTTRAQGECNVEVDHADASSVVLYRTGADYGGNMSALKVFIDVTNKRLVRTIEYWPAGVDEVWIEGNALLAQFTAQGYTTQDTYTLEMRDGMLQLDRGAAPPVKQDLPAPWSLLESGKFPGEFTAVVERGPALRSYELEKTDQERLARLRPRMVREAFGGYPAAEINDHIGPHQLVGNLLWFGKTFYDGEGHTGVGGFGYFDFSTKRFVMIAPASLYDWSASAILVEPDAVWIGLVDRPEAAERSGGLLRYDRNTTQTRVLPVKDVIKRIVRHNGTLHLGTTHGLYVMQGAGFSRYLIEPSLDGSITPIEIP